MKFYASMILLSCLLVACVVLAVRQAHDAPRGSSVYDVNYERAADCIWDRLDFISTPTYVEQAKVIRFCIVVAQHIQYAP